MNPRKSVSRRRRTFQLTPEALEDRALMTSGAGDTFAFIPGTVSKAGGTATVSFTLNPQNFTFPSGKMTIGIDVVANTGDNSTVKPQIVSVKESNGHVLPLTRSNYPPQVLHQLSASGGVDRAVLTPISVPAASSTVPVTYTVEVKGLKRTSGDFLVGFYLPGDTTGTGAVTAADVQTVKSLQHTLESNAKYSFNADVNRDGEIGPIDMTFTKKNVGVTTNVSPVVEADLVATSVTSPATRTSTKPTASFSGTATPGAKITYTLTDSPSVAPVTTTSSSAGTYTITVPLAIGSNTFMVQSVDPFGQTISGTISPVFYTPAT